MTYTEFIKSKRTSPFYIISGDEEFLKEKLVDLISEKKQKLVQGDDVTIEKLLDELYTPDLMGGHKLVIVKDEKGFAAKHQEALAKYAQAPSACATLVVICEKPPLISNALHIECAAPRRPDLIKFAQASFSEKGAKIVDRALEELVTRQQNSLRQLEQEIEKLSSFSKMVTLDDVLALSQDESVSKVFELATHTSKSDKERALATLHKLLDQGESIQMILATLAWQFRKMTELSRSIKQGAQPYAAATSLGIKFNAYDFINAVKGISTRMLEKKIQHILDADILLKSSQIDQVAIMDTLIIKLCNK